MTFTRSTGTHVPAVEAVLELYTALNRGAIAHAREYLDGSRWLDHTDRGMPDGDPGKPLLEWLYGPVLDADRTAPGAPRPLDGGEETVIVEGAFVGAAIDGSATESSFVHVYEVVEGEIVAAADCVDLEDARGNVATARAPTLE